MDEEPDHHGGNKEKPKGCGAHVCRIEKPVGMGHNGPCRCHVPTCTKETPCNWPRCPVCGG